MDMRLRVIVLVASVIALGPLAYGAQELNLELRAADGRPVPDLVVILEGSTEIRADNPSSAIIEQRNKRFVPQISVIQTGTIVEFPNQDSVGHHVYSFARPNVFELPLYTSKLRPNVRFDEAGVVTLGCNIHDSMLGYVVVADTPHFGITNSRGELRLRDLPADTYQVKIWSPKIDPLQWKHVKELVLGESDETHLPITLAEKSIPSLAIPEDSLDWEHY